MALLKERVSLVTGAGGGIGRGVARAFAREGAAVVIAEIDEKTGSQVEREIKELGGRALFVKTDVTSKASIEARWRASAASTFS
jgi:3-oxoacyl-[acyl-carrier protein] reductase